MPCCSPPAAAASRRCRPWRTAMSTWQKQINRDSTRPHSARLARRPQLVRLEWQNHFIHSFGIYARAPPAFLVSRAKLPHGVSCVSPLLPALFLRLGPSLQAASSREIAYMQAGQCGNQMGTKFRRCCATSTASATTASTAAITTRNLTAPTPAMWRAFSSDRPVRAMAVHKCSKCCQLFFVNFVGVRFSCGG